MGTYGSCFPAMNDHPNCAGWSAVAQAGDSELPLLCCRRTHLPRTELTDSGGDMPPTNVTGELQALHHALLLLPGMPEEELSTLTSILILTD